MPPATILDRCKNCWAHHGNATINDLLKEKAGMMLFIIHKPVRQEGIKIL